MAEREICTRIAHVIGDDGQPTGETLRVGAVHVTGGRGVQAAVEWLDQYTREARRERGQCEECGDPAEEEIRGELLCADCASAYHPLPDEYDEADPETPQSRDRDAEEMHGPRHHDPSGEE